eukprot:TRINITY_DN2637_c0_g1_i1.p1 TRINITY_DN2637_c0_g1~~TRINITY_DN2637_c0_g1_i1.p1  ORF type:complete len:110 (+),score=14.56 TRINITY_DN2637_c0_g1_i1:407-736(+)
MVVEERIMRTIRVLAIEHRIAVAIEERISDNHSIGSVEGQDRLSGNREDGSMVPFFHLLILFALALFILHGLGQKLCSYSNLSACSLYFVKRRIEDAMCADWHVCVMER